MSRNEARSLDLRCPRTSHHERHEKHSIWNPLSWNGDDEKGSLLSPIILTGSVGER
jgi:hypothetical protein